MIQAATTPDALTLIRTAIALVVLLYLPGRVFLTKKTTKESIPPERIEALAEAVFVSAVLLALAGMVLVFSVGLNEITLAIAYLLIGVYLWTRRTS